MPTTSGRSAARAARPSGSPRTAMSTPARSTRRMAPRSPTRLHLHGNSDVYIIPARRRRSAAHHLAPCWQRAWSAGRPTAKTCSSAVARPASGTMTGSSASTPTAPAFPSRCLCPPGSRAPSRPTASRWLTSPVTKWQPAWKRYVGGQTTPIWIVNLKTLDLGKVPRENSNDSNPVWVGDQVYFLSDRDSAGKNNGPVTLYRYDTKEQAGLPGDGQHRAGHEVLPGRARNRRGRVEPNRPGCRAVRPHPAGGPRHGHEHADPYLHPRRIGQPGAPPGEHAPG